MGESISKRRPLLTWVGILILVGMEAFFFRNVLFSDYLIGDAWDGRLTMLFTEHWFHVFRGEAGITDMGFFYPAANTLAYSDMFLSFGLIHSLLRFLGLDIYIAFKFSIIFIHLLGTIFTFKLLNDELEVDFWWSLFGTIVFSFSNTYAILITHPQLLALSFIPILAIFLIRFFRNIESRKKRIRYAVLSIITLMMILYTAWYIFFFAALFVFTGIIVWICSSISRKDGKIACVLKTMRGMIPELILYCLILALLMVPFAVLELPVLKMSGGRDYGEVWGALPEAADYINVSTENWALGGLMRAMKLDERGYTFEVVEGFSIVLVFAFLFTGFFFRRKRTVYENDARNATRYFLASNLAIAVVISCLLILRLSSNGVSLWWAVFHVFPGATSIRAVARYLLFLSFPLALVTAYMGNEVSGRLREKGKFYSILMAVVVILAGISTVHTGGVFARWTKTGTMAFIENVPAPPADCESFYLSDVIEGESGPYYQLDAYQIADKFGIHTIHGYSGIEPPGWGNMWDVHGDRYQSSVAGWILDHKLEHVYAYDEVKRTWTPFEEMIAMKPGDVFDAAKKQIPEAAFGIWDMVPEGEYSWTHQNFKVQLQNANISTKGLKIRYGTVLDKYLAQNSNLEPECFIYVNGERIRDLPVTNEVQEIILDVKAAENDFYEVEVRTNCFFIPAVIGENGDSRSLAIQLYYIGAGDE